MTKASILNCLSLDYLSPGRQLLPMWVTLWSCLSLLEELETACWQSREWPWRPLQPLQMTSPCQHLRATSGHTIGQEPAQIHDPQKLCQIPDIYYCKLPGFRVICYIVIDNYCINYLHLNLLPCAFRIHHTYHPAIATMQAHLKRHLLYKVIPSLLLHILSAVSFIFTQNLVLNSTVTLVTLSSVVCTE